MRQRQVDLERRVTRLERHARFYQSMLLLGVLGGLAAVLYLKGKGSLRFFDADGAVTMQIPPSPDRAAD